MKWNQTNRLVATDSDPPRPPGQMCSSRPSRTLISRGRSTTTTTTSTSYFPPPILLATITTSIDYIFYSKLNHGSNSKSKREVRSTTTTPCCKYGTILPPSATKNTTALLLLLLLLGSSSGPVFASTVVNASNSDTGSNPAHTSGLDQYMRVEEGPVGGDQSEPNSIDPLSSLLPKSSQTDRFESNSPDSIDSTSRDSDSNMVNSVNSHENEIDDEDGGGSGTVSSSPTPNQATASPRDVNSNRLGDKSDWSENAIEKADQSLPSTTSTTTATTTTRTGSEPDPHPISFDFTRSVYNVSIPENSLSKVYASSAEKMGIYISDPALSVRYRIVAGDVDKIFRADHKHVGDFYFLLIRIRHGSNSVLNREYRSSYELRVRATITSEQNKAIRFKSKCNVSVTVTDINDISPIFVEENYHVDVPEDVPLDTQVAKVVAVDPDIGLNGEVYYSLAEGSQTLFAIHPTQGALYTTRPLSLHSLLNSHTGHKEQDSYLVHLNVYAKDRGFHRTSSQVIEFSKAKVHIRVTPVNRFPPHISIKQHSTLGTTGTDLFVPQQRPIYAVVHISDQDIGVYGEICSFEIVSGNEQGFFILTNQSSSRDYKLELVKSISDLFALSYTLPFGLVVLATDCGGLHSNDTIYISLDSQLNLGFQFSSDNYYREVHEASLVGTTVLQVDLKFLYDDVLGKNKVLDKAKDSVHLEMFEFSIISGNENGTFGISRNGVVYTRLPLDRERKAKYVLVVQAQHQLNQLATSMVHVDVVDDNDNWPVFEDVASSGVVHVVVSENRPNASVVYQAVAIDADSGNNGYVTYSLVQYESDPHFPFVIDPYSGNVSLARSLDYEMSARNYHVFIRASDWGEPFRRQSQMLLNVSVADANDHRPQFEKYNCTVVVPIATKPYTELVTFRAIDLDANSTVRYKLYSDFDKCFHLNELSGVLELTCNLRKEMKALGLSENTWTLQVLANDGHYFADSNYVRVVVSSVVSGESGEAYIGPDKRNPKSKVSVECAHSAIVHKWKHQLRVEESLSHQVNQAEREAIEAMSAGGEPNNHDAPVFDSKLSEISIREDTAVNSKIATFLANDTDEGFNGALVWSLNSQQVESGKFHNDRVYFEMDQFSGELFLISQLDFEQEQEMSLLVTVCDQSVSQQKCSNQSVRVVVEDVNDNPPLIGHYVFKVSESTPVKSVIGTIHATDKDSGDNAVLEYLLEGHADTFSIDLFNGSVRLEKGLDRETIAQYSVYVVVSDYGTPALSSTALVTINVEDVNDNAPQFFQSSYFLRVREDIPIGTRLTRISAFDRDEGASSEIRYSLANTELATIFLIDELTGNIRLGQQLDYEKVQMYNLTVVASDEGKPPLASATHLVVEVEDVNENYYAPRFADIYATASVKENLPAGTLVTQVTAVDKDNPTLPLIYQIVGGSGLGRFSVDSTGNVLTTTSLDCETHSHFWLTIAAKDRAAVPKTSYLELYIEVEDVNDMPSVTKQSFYHGQVYENVSIGTVLLKLEAHDQDFRLSKNKTRISYRITNSVPFDVDAQGVIRSNAELDCEQMSRYVLDVEVSEPLDPGQTGPGAEYLTSRTPVIVDVLDVNEFEPKSVLRTYRCKTFTQVNLDMPLCHIIAFDPDHSEQCHLRYELVEGNEKGYFKLDPTSGIIYSTVDTLPKGSYDFMVKFSDCGQPEAAALSSTVHVIIRVLPVSRKENNQRPYIEPIDSMVVVNRNDEVGHTVAWIKSVDDDGDPMLLSISGGNTDHLFAFLDNGALVIAKSLRGHLHSRFNLSLSVSDGQDKSTTDLVVNVLNEQDRVASFHQSSYTVNVLENITLGSTVLAMSVIESDLTSAGTLFSIYSAQSPDTLAKFEVDSWSGKIKVSNVIDYECGKQHSMVIEARGAMKNSRSFNNRAFAQVIINVIDVNDETPKFILPYFEASVLESASLGTSIVQVQAFDADYGNNARLEYSVVGGNIDRAFEVEPQLGYIYLTKRLNFREQPEYYLTVRATDNGLPPLASTADVHIVVGVPDNSPPKFEQANYFVDIREDEKVGTVIFSLRLCSKQSTFFELVSGNHDGVFAINVNNGEVYLRKRLDYERVKNYTLTVSAVSLFAVNDTATVFVSVLDINDNAPYWRRTRFEGQVFDTMPLHSVVLTEQGSPLVVQAYDNDSVHNAVLAYAIVEESARHYFQIEPRTGAISLVKKLGFEKFSQMSFSVSVADHGLPSLKAATNAVVHIRYLPVNDCPPVFSLNKFRAILLLPTYPNVLVTRVTATDCDFQANSKNSLNQGLRFNLTSVKPAEEVRFRINSTTGQITTLTEQIEERVYELNVTAFDGKFTSTAMVIITARPIPRSSLRFRENRFCGSVRENSSQVRTVLTPTIDGNKLHENLLFRILNPTTHFRIVLTAGAILFTGNPIDREEVSKIELAIEVQSISNRHRVAHATVEIEVEDINDNQPIFVGLPYNFIFNSNSEHGTSIGRIQAVDLDSGQNGLVTYSIVSGDSRSLFSVNSQTGQLTLARTLSPHDPLHYCLLVMARDFGEPSLESHVNVTLRIVSGDVPLFSQPYYNVSVSEAHQPMLPFITLKAESPSAHQVVYNIESGNENDEFTLDFNTGLVSITEKLDRESTSTYSLVISATDAITGATSNTLLYIEVGDANDNYPMFNKFSYNVSVKESVPVGMAIVKVSASDADLGLNSRLEYHIVGNKTGQFYMSPDEGVVYLKQPLDYETESVHYFSIMVTDYGSPQLTSTAQVWINVLDVNDNPPVLPTSFTTSIDESIAKREFVTKITANDADWSDRDKLRYKILSGSDMAFYIDELSGAIFVRNLQSSRYSYHHQQQHVFHSEHRSRHIKRQYSLNVSVSDGIYSATEIYFVHIKPSNNFSPKFNRLVNHVAIDECKSVGETVFTVNATDRDESLFGQVEYRLLNDYGRKYFSLDPFTGAISLKSPLDYDQGDKFYWLVLAAQDRGKRVGVSALRVAITDHNDHMPRFIVAEYRCSVCANAPLGSNIVSVLALDDDDDEPNTLIKYSIYEGQSPATATTSSSESDSNSTIVYINDYFQIASDTGYIYVGKNLSTLAGKVVQFFVKATNGNGGQSEQIENVVPVTIQISNSCLRTKTDAFLYEVFVKENIERGSVVANLNLDSYKEAEMSIVGLDDKLDSSRFRIDKFGQIFADEILDREQKSKHVLAIELRDKSTLVADYYYVIINIMDENDCTPYFDSASYYLHLAENQEIGSYIYKLNALDDDIDLLNNAIKYRLNDTFGDTFLIDENNGWITLNKELDRERQPQYTLTVLVSDGLHSNHTSLQIDLFDINDNAPVIRKSRQFAAILENSPLGTVILRIDTLDADLNAELRYFVVEGDYLNQFAVTSTGDVYVNKPLDREFLDQYRLKILVTDGKYQTQTEVIIEILDVNDNGPVCVKSKYVEMVSEAVQPDTYILTVEAVDADDKENGRLYFALSGEARNHFAIDPLTGRLKTRASLDRETQASYLFDVVVYDDKNRDWSCTSQVEILLSDVNDEAPRFINPVNSVNIPEDSPVGVILGKVTAIDSDLGVNRRISYGLVNATGEFVLSENFGIIRLEKSLDREEKSFYNISIEAVDGGTVPLRTLTFFTVNVTDINDNAPEFQMQAYRGEVDENVPTGTEVVRIFATSKDTGINAEIQYSLVSGNENDTFVIHAKTGVVSVARPLDYETSKEYFLTVKAEDQGVPPLSSEVSLVVTVNDINDVRPQFVQRSYDIVIREDAQVGDRILQLVAIDLDSPPNANLTYSFGGGSLAYKEFRVEPVRGILTVARQLDREMMSSYILEVFCSDNGQPKPLFSSVLINVEISDYNDNPPLFDKLNQTIHVQESRPVGYILHNFNIQDADGPMNSGPFKLEIVEGNEDNSFLVLDSDASLRTNTILAHANVSHYVLKIKVTDSGNPPLHSYNWITLVIIEEPQMPPKLQSQSIRVNLLDQFPGGLIGRLNASDEDRFDKLTYSLVNDDDRNSFSVNANDGSLLAFPGLDSGEYRLNITVTDGKFVSHGTVEVEVALITEAMIEHSMVIEIRAISAKDFVATHMKNFVRVLKSLFGVRSRDVTILSVQPAERKSLRRDRRGDDWLSSGHISLMFVVAIPNGGYFTRNWLKTKLMESKFLIESQLGLSFEEVLLKSECEHIQCRNGECREDLVLSETEIVPVISGKFSFVSPVHEYRFGCSCRAGFGGQLCNVTVNECYRSPCPPFKQCVPVSTALGYLCQCPFGKSGPRCNQNAEICHSNDRDVSFCSQEFNPISFTGNSYVRYAHVKRIDKISLRFRSQQSRTRIFTQQNERAFSILEIIGGFVQYRFDCGEGEGLIRMHNLVVNDGQWHEIIVERKGSNALLTLDRKYRGGGFAPGTLSSCSRLKDDIYFGGEVKSISDSIGDEDILNGFAGCLDNILFNGQQIPFHLTSKSSVVTLKTLANVEFTCNFRPYTGACKSQPCLNGGTCVNEPNGTYSCACLGPRYAGQHCEIDTDPCESSPCMNEGVCHVDHQVCESGLPLCYKCQCRKGFTGLHCQLSRYCSASFCQNGGVCKESSLGPKCQCHSGWHGHHCQHDVDECALSTPTCTAPATCINLPGTYRCLCPLNSTVPCNGEGLIPSNIIASQFYFSREEMFILIIILALLFLFGCILVMCCNSRNRKLKKPKKHPANGGFGANSTYENFPLNFPHSKTNLEMSNMAKNAVLLRQQRPNSYDECLEQTVTLLSPEEGETTNPASNPDYGQAFKKNAPIASVSPQLIETRRSPKSLFVGERHKSKNSLTDLKETHKKRVSLNDSADSNVFNDEQPQSLTNSNQTEGYHWDDSYLYLNEVPTVTGNGGLAEFPGQVNGGDGESNSEQSQPETAPVVDSSKHIYSNVNRLFKTRRLPVEPHGGGDESFPLLGAGSGGGHTDTKHLTGDASNASSPDVKLSTKFDHSRNYINCYLPKHEEEWSGNHNHNGHHYKRKNILTYMGDSEVEGSGQSGVQPDRKCSVPESKPVLSTFQRSSLNDSGDNFSLLTPSSSCSTTPIAALVTSSSDTTDQCPSSLSSSSHTDHKTSPVNDSKAIYVNGSHSTNNLMVSFGYGHITKRTSPPTLTNGEQAESKETNKTSANPDKSSETGQLSSTQTTYV